MVRYLAVLSVSAIMVSTASASEDADIKAQLDACLEIPSGAERLACFEAVAASSERVGAPVTPAAPATPAVPAAQGSAEAEQAQRGWRLFGFGNRKKPVTSEQEFGLGITLEDEISEITEISGKIVAVEMQYGKAVRIELDNGQVWRQLQADGTPLRLFREDTTYTAVLSKGMFSSHFMKIEPWGKVIRVRRIQ